MSVHVQQHHPRIGRGLPGAPLESVSSIDQAPENARDPSRDPPRAQSRRTSEDSASRRPAADAPAT